VTGCRGFVQSSPEPLTRLSEQTSVRPARSGRSPRRA
jgi:hypothetical protein